MSFRSGLRENWKMRKRLDEMEVVKLSVMPWKKLRAKIADLIIAERADEREKCAQIVDKATCGAEDCTCSHDIAALIRECSDEAPAKSGGVPD